MPAGGWQVFIPMEGQFVTAPLYLQTLVDYYIITSVGPDQDAAHAHVNDTKNRPISVLLRWL
jgi:hypothetical protein